MNGQKPIDRSADMMLSSPSGVPFPFSIVIKGAWPTSNSECTLEIKGKEAISGVVKTNKYFLYDRNHSTYLDLFEQLANDFGLRLPQNRRPVIVPDFKVSYNEILRTNLVPGILYGYGDPAVIRIKQSKDQEVWYYVVATSNDASDSFPIIRSQDLLHWEFVNYVFPKGKKPVWAAEGEFSSDFWAPEIHWFENEYRVYFVARDRHTHELCIGMARSLQPEGPFLADPAPILKNNVIDPHIFLLNDTTAYLYWKKDNNDIWPQRLIELLYQHPHLISELFPEKEDQVTASFIVTIWPWIQLLEPIERFLVSQVLIEAVISIFIEFYNHLKTLQHRQPTGVQTAIHSVLDVMKTPVYAQQLSPDGANLIGEPIKIIENDLAWEAHLVEGIWVTKQLDKYFLFYAGNDFSTNQYGIGVAVADSPLGPFKKTQKPFLQSTKEWWAPGHPSLAQGPDGKPLLFLHAYFPGKAGYKQFRALLSLSITFKDDAVQIL